MSVLAAAIREQKQKEEEERKKRQAEAEARLAESFAAQSENGATAGMPLYLQTTPSAPESNDNNTQSETHADQTSAPQATPQAELQAKQPDSEAPTESITTRQPASPTPEKATEQARPEQIPLMQAIAAITEPVSQPTVPELNPDSTQAALQSPIAPEIPSVPSVPLAQPEAGTAAAPLPQPTSEPAQAPPSQNATAATPPVAAPLVQPPPVSAPMQAVQPTVASSAPTPSPTPSTGSGGMESAVTATGDVSAPESVSAETSPQGEAAAQTESKMEAATPEDVAASEAIAEGEVEPTDIPGEAEPVPTAEAAPAADLSPPPIPATGADMAGGETPEPASTPDAEMPLIPGPEPTSSTSPDTTAATGGSASSAPAATETSEAPDEVAPEPTDAAPAPEASSEDVAPTEKQAALDALAEGTGGGGEAAAGGGGGSAIADKPAPAVPDVSGAEPTQALAAVSQLPPVQLQSALSGVSAAVGNTVNSQRAELAANPPQMERPTGSPITKQASGNPSLSPATVLKSIEKVPEGTAQPTPSPLPVSLPPPPPLMQTDAVVRGDGAGNLSANDIQGLQASVRQMPTSDPGLNVTAGSPPPLTLQGDADPIQAQAQHAKLEQNLSEAHAQGQQELAQPMGETDLYPVATKEVLRAEVAGGAVAGGGGAAGSTAGPAMAAAGDDAVSVVAQQEHGEEIQGAVAQAQGQMAAQQQQHTDRVAQERQTSNQEISRLQTENAATQAQERSAAQAEVQQQRSAWSQEQSVRVNQSRQEAGAAVAKGMTQVQQEQTKAQAKAGEHIEKGNQEAQQARLRGEEQALAEKRKAEQESSGIFGWLASQAKTFFEGIKQGIRKAFEVARAAVKAAIEAAKTLAAAAIEAGRQAIVAVIRATEEVLIGISSVYLAAFPGLRDRFRSAIRSRVSQAEAYVNAKAEELKQLSQAALNLLGRGLDAALGLLERGMLAAVDAVSQATQSAIASAKSALEALGAFAEVAKDVAGNPGGWLSNLGASAADGVRNHLWSAFKTAVQEWFHQKLEEVLGLGMTIWNLLKQGGISAAEVGKMAWEGIKSAIPPALIQILLEQVVAILVPAAGLVLKIIQGLQAAWGSISRILQAMEKFVAFLKAVKTGQAGAQFGAMLAAAGVVLIDFAANWLLGKIRGGATKVAAKIKAIAQKLGKRFKKAFKKAKRNLGKFFKKLGKKASRLKEKVFGKKPTKPEKGRERKKNLEKQDKSQDKQQQLARIVSKIELKVRQFVRRGKTREQVSQYLGKMRSQHRLSSLYLVSRPNGGFRFHATLNPDQDSNTIGGIDIVKVKLKVRDILLQDPVVRAAIERYKSQLKGQEPIQIVSGLDAFALGEARQQAGRGAKPKRKSKIEIEVGHPEAKILLKEEFKGNVNYELKDAGQYIQLKKEMDKVVQTKYGGNVGKFISNYEAYLKTRKLPPELSNDIALSLSVAHLAHLSTTTEVSRLKTQVSDLSLGLERGELKGDVSTFVTQLPAQRSSTARDESGNYIRVSKDESGALVLNKKGAPLKQVGGGTAGMLVEKVVSGAKKEPELPIEGEKRYQSKKGTREAYEDILKRHEDQATKGVEWADEQAAVQAIVAKIKRRVLGDLKPE